jgi:LPS sulfotransferase NodH
LLWVEWGNEYVALPSWRDWFAATGVDAAKLNRDLVFSLPSAAVDAAVESQGFALVQHSLAVAFSRVERGRARQASGRRIPRVDHPRSAPL